MTERFESRPRIDELEHPETHPYPPIRLRATVVRYEDGPNRCTVYPSGLADVERLTTWLSADADVFVPLAAMR